MNKVFDFVLFLRRFTIKPFSYEFLVCFMLTILVGFNKCSSKDAHSKDCPHPCVVNGHHFCEPPPCPPPACQDPVYAPGQCCTVCPKDCPHGTCKIGNRTMCYPIPCPLPPCQKPVTTPGDCCPHCPKEEKIMQKREECPHPCVIGGQTYCHPIPCPLPLCDDPVTTPGECCPRCH
uniref:Cysteine-rich motor neuron 1 protein-like n=1 Tax=Crassostrea virginica TaxID=6565 RepID=A0A8B8BGL4_CRAVI|nr:cysteine-rich motor neuron 1 protein-like [Crassostrea virginica]